MQEIKLFSNRCNRDGTYFRKRKIILHFTVNILLLCMISPCNQDLPLPQVTHCSGQVATILLSDFLSNCLHPEMRTYGICMDIKCLDHKISFFSQICVWAVTIVLVTLASQRLNYGIACNSSMYQTIWSQITSAVQAMCNTERHQILANMLILFLDGLFYLPSFFVDFTAGL